ncbi:hypothetical protein ACD591_12245 [Rufibacter glacialis]|uniref:DUF2798 domain-containing protein n=1 Tax=Rufibacter glacialis TaxID=1259555 RepID=A0A5M8QST8_9BACT|nr:hypothetical protein [Rufibacter glacialis]KAA6437262.1 hypothetical protein FOE74_01825 [Rufibacter glacialis]GGK60657.1 hypothetical protein GCM10011405_06070 [Rufibacter glacialis]
MAKVLKRHPFQRDWRRDLLIAGLISMLLAMALLLYTFGLTSDFIFRLFNAFLVVFILLAGTAFVIVPGVNWVFMRFSKKKPKTTKAAPRQAAAPKRNLPKINRTED